MISKAILLEKALAIDDTLKEAWSDLGGVYDSQGKNELAIDAYKHALYHDPKYISALNNIGVAYNNAEEYEKEEAKHSYFKLRNYPEALKCLEKAVELKNNYALAWYNLAQVQYANRDYNQAFLSDDP